METRIVKGGQGRSSASVREDASAITFVALLALALVALAIVRELSCG